MKTKMPFKVTLKGTEDVVVIGDTWNTVKNWGFGIALIALVFLFCAFGFPALLVVLAIAAAIFGVRIVLQQSTVMGKIGASGILLVLIGGLLFGAWMLQKPESAPVRALNAVLPQTAPVATRETPAVEASPSQLAQIAAPVSIVPSKIETEHRAGGGGSGISAGRETTESPPVTRQTPHDTLPPVVFNDECDPGGEKASAWGQR